MLALSVGYDRILLPVFTGRNTLAASGRRVLWGATVLQGKLGRPRRYEQASRLRQADL